MAVLFSGLALSPGSSAQDISVAGADLIVIDICWTDMFGAGASSAVTITSGQPYAVQATIENVGSGTITTFWTDLYLDGSLVGSVACIGGLAASGTLVVSWDGLVTSESGSHEVSVLVDSQDSVVENNADGTGESNNVMTGALDVANAEWTLAIYFDADNNLEYVAALDFLELASVGTTAAVNIVVQYDRIEGMLADYGDWSDAKRFLVTQGMEPFAESAYEDLGEVNMGDGSTLSDFVSDTFGRFRADKTCLVLWDHGGGWYRGCCRDQTSLNDSLKTDELRGALAEAVGGLGASVGIVAFDACTMSTMEVCYAFQDLCVNFVACEAGVPGTGFPYHLILGALTGSPSMEPEQFCEVIVSSYLTAYQGFPMITLSAFRVDAVCTGVRDALSDLADSLIAGGDRYDRRIEAAREAVSGFDIIPTDPDLEDSYSADIYYFAEEVASRIPDKRVQTAAADLMSALEDARIVLGVCASFRTEGQIFGIMVFWPEVEVYLEEYTSERLALDSTWDEFLLAFYAE